jgi:hypothetical protein
MSESYAYKRAKDEFLDGEQRRVWGTVAIYEKDMTAQEKKVIAGKLYHYYDKQIAIEETMDKHNSS